MSTQPKLSDDDLGEVVRQIVITFDDLPRPLLPTVRRIFRLCVADAVVVLRAAAATVARYDQIPEIPDDD